MGSWYATDMITHMPIRYEDPIRAVVLKQRTCAVGCGGITYPYSMWEPIGPALKGVYNDYGCIKEVENSVGADWLVDFIKLGEKTMEKLSSHGIEDRTPIEIVALAIERGLVYKEERDYFYKTAEDECSSSGDYPVMRKYLCLWMVHEETWQTMQTLDYERVLRSTVDQRAQELKDICGNLPEDSMKRTWALSDKLEALLRDHIPNEASFHWGRRQNRTNDVIDELTELVKVSTAMDALRYYFCPVSGAGSCWTNYEAHKELAELTIKQAEKGIEWESDYE